MDVIGIASSYQFLRGLRDQKFAFENSFHDLLQVIG
jgi:hypothetical protein